MTRQNHSLADWNELPAEEQLRLREEYGHVLDRMPPTCSLDSKIERFSAWLRDRGIRYEHPTGK